MINFPQMQGGAVVSVTNVYGLLATVTGVDLKTVAATTLYTVPTGKTLVITEIVMRITAADTVNVAPSLGVGKAAAYNQWLDTTLVTQLTAAGQFLLLSNLVGSVANNTFAAADVVKVNVTVGADATTMTGAFDVWGYVL